MIENEVTSNTTAARVQTILCVDGELTILSSLRQLFVGLGFEVLSAQSGKTGLALLASHAIDLVISDMQVPDMNGAKFLEQVRERWPDTVRILLAGQSDIDSFIRAINQAEIFRYVTKPWDEKELILTVRRGFERATLERERRRLEWLGACKNEDVQVLSANFQEKVEAGVTELGTANELLRAANEKLKTSFVTLIKMLSSLIEMRGGNLAGHARRVADLSRRIASQLQLDNKQLQELFVAGLLHEIGKISFTDEMLGTAVTMMKSPQLKTYYEHAGQAEQLLLTLPELAGAGHIIGAQFERFDGTGLPHRRAAERIPVSARILSVASDYDNLQIGTLDRRNLNAEEAKRIILHGSGKLYDPKVVEAFIKALGVVPVREDQTKSFHEVPVRPNRLQLGMVLSRDLISDGGLQMLSAGDMLDEHLIRKIVNFEKFCDPQLTVHIRVDRRV